MALKLTDEWWTAPAEAESGRTVMVTGRDDMQRVIDTGKYIYRIDVSWTYEPTPDGMPGRETAALLEQATDALRAELRRDTAAVLTGIYTGDGRRDWVFYTRSLHIFQSIFNRALEPLPQMPLLIEAEEDPDWEEYREMRSMTYIPPEE